MGKIAYIEKKFKQSSLDIIELADNIIEEYALDDMDLTLRQLYYQFVSRDLIANKQTEYKRLGDIISNARLAGLIDWNAIEDRTRSIKSNYHNTDPGDAVNDSLDCFCLNKWIDQPYRIEVWIEKEALTGVISKICTSLDIPFFACKGYTSQSEMWRAGRRLCYYESQGQSTLIIHLGDHDPSGIDMTRDISDRLELFESTVTVKRIALNYDQVEMYDPPPNPAKLTDSRAKDYISNYGKSSWELDALEPRVIRALIKDTVNEFTDHKLMKKTIKKETEYKKTLENVVKNWKKL
jgi:hypothetical protein